MSNHSFHFEKTHVVVMLSGNLDSRGAKAFEDDRLSVLEQQRPVLLDLKNVSAMSAEWERSLIALQKELRENSKEMVMVSVPGSVFAEMKKGGIDGIFKFSNTMKEAMNQIGLAPKIVLDMEFINPFLDAVLNVLQTQASVNAVSVKAQLKKNRETLEGDVSGIIQLESRSFNGQVIVSFPSDTFLQVMSSMLGEQYFVVNQEILDGAAEILNMVFGQAKVVLNQNGHGIGMARPYVHVGRDLSSASTGPSILLPFESTAGEFFVEIRLD